MSAQQHSTQLTHLRFASLSAAHPAALHHSVACLAFRCLMYHVVVSSPFPPASSSSPCAPPAAACVETSCLCVDWRWAAFISSVAHSMSQSMGRPLFPRQSTAMARASCYSLSPPLSHSLGCSLPVLG